MQQLILKFSTIIEKRRTKDEMVVVLRSEQLEGIFHCMVLK